MTATTIIRENLKKLGLKQTQVSVRGSTSIKVTIRDAGVDFAAVEAIASTHEKISRDHATGEILCGGNTFVDVAYADEVLDAAAKPHLAKIEEAVAAGRDYVLGSWDDGYLVCKNDVRDSITIWRLRDRAGGHVAEAWRAPEAARSLALVLLKTGRRDLLSGGGAA